MKKNHHHTCGAVTAHHQSTNTNNWRPNTPTIGASIARFSLKPPVFYPYLLICSGETSFVAFSLLHFPSSMPSPFKEFFIPAFDLVPLKLSHFWLLYSTLSTTPYFNSTLKPRQDRKRFSGREINDVYTCTVYTHPNLWCCAVLHYNVASLPFIFIYNFAPASLHVKSITLMTSEITLALLALNKCAHKCYLKW